MGKLHQVQSGESISSLEADYGIPANSIWNDPKNSDLRARRSSKDQLLPGDNIYIREREERTESGNTEQRHRFRKKIGFGITIRIDIDPKDEENKNDHFVLKSTDGSYRIEKTVKDDLVPGDAYVDLHFSGLKRKKRYTLEIFAAADAQSYTVFQNVPYDELAKLSATQGAPLDERNQEEVSDEHPYPDEPDGE